VRVILKCAYNKFGSEKLSATENTMSNPKHLQPIGKRIINSLGFGKDGRVNYDYDTGNLLSDFALELIRDPLNIIEFGAKTVE
jgi:hypothetical protein